MKKERVFKGIALHAGITIGKPYFVLRVETARPLQSKMINVEQEVSKFRNALGRSKIDLHALQKSMLNEGSPEIVEILDTHLEMLQDPFITKLEEKIRNSPNTTAESVFIEAISAYKAKFSCKKDVFFKERIGDVIDVSRRVLGHLRPVPKIDFAKIPEGSIVIAQEFVPSTIAELDPKNVLAIVSEKGSFTSHSAIIAKAKGLVYVAGIDLSGICDIEEILVDGKIGEVIINPTQKTKLEYEQRKKQWDAFTKELEKKAHLPSITSDGYSVDLWGNVENVAEVEKIINARAKGIGLYRSESLVLSKGKFPSEEEQFFTYATLLQKAGGRPVVIRVFDLGGDKMVDHPSLHAAQDSFGKRGIRFLLEEKELFQEQLRALLRAAIFGDLKILLPMVSDVGEILEVQELLKSAAASLRKSGIDHNASVLLGAMIELPAAAILVEEIADACSFLSIGSNDLTGLVLAVGRSDTKLNEKYSSYHPSILKLLAKIVKTAKKKNKLLLLCGELGSDEKATSLLLGLGIRAFSVSTSRLPYIKESVREASLKHAEELAEKALLQNTLPEIKTLLEKFMRKS